MRHRPARTARGRAARQEGGGRDGGYILATMGLLLVPLLLFTAFAVDVGGWYARGAKLQRVADAAALAGAARMPDFPIAQTLAVTTARLNGIVDTATIDIVVTQGANDRQIKVTITDRDVAQFLSQIVLDNMTIIRSSTAEFVLPVPLGSPDNYFGNDPVNPPSVQPGLWGNIHGPQTDNGKGDQYAAGCRGTTGCSTKTPQYTGSYIYAIDVPPGGTSNLRMQIYDAGMYHRTTEQTETGDTRYSLTTQITTWEMFYKDDTPLDASDNINNHSMASGGPSAERCQSGTPGRFTIAQEASSSTYKNKWATVCQLSTAPEGRYYLRVSTSGDGDFANRYSLRVLPSTGSGKPRLSAYSNMSMFNNSLLTTPSFYLAQVLPVHQGKALIVNLYDPGEIGVPNAKMLIQRPNATGTGVTTAQTCKLSVYTNPTDTAPASTTTLSPCSIATTNGSGGGLYGNRLLKIEIVLGVADLGAAYTCATCWWKVRYDLGASPTGTPADTTTWSAAIKGDPVHLINE
jgi:hypothetical protein